MYAAVREQFNDEELIYLTLAIISINGWNRLAISFRTLPE
jgi:alkylhydroperoxidase family enzyme